MEANHFQPRGLGLALRFGAFGRRYGARIERRRLRLQRERRDLHAGVSEPPDGSEPLGQRPIGEDFVAAGEFHRDNSDRDENHTRSQLYPVFQRVIPNIYFTTEDTERTEEGGRGK